MSTARHDIAAGPIVQRWRSFESERTTLKKVVSKYTKVLFAIDGHHSFFCGQRLPSLAAVRHQAAAAVKTTANRWRQRSARTGLHTTVVARLANRFSARQIRRRMRGSGAMVRQSSVTS